MSDSEPDSEEGVTRNEEVLVWAYVLYSTAKRRLSDE